MLSIAPGCNHLIRAVIANGLSLVSSNIKQESVILDFSVCSSEAFWSVYKNGVKYLEDILPVLPKANLKILKSFIAPVENSSYVVGLKEQSLENINQEILFYFLFQLEKIFDDVIIILPDIISNNFLKIIEHSHSVLIPFLSDALSVRNAISISEKYVELSKSEIKLFPFRLKHQHEFHCETLLDKYEIFKNHLSCDFNYDIEERILSERFSYRDKSVEIVSCLYKILQTYKRTQTTQLEDLSLKYYQNESVYKQLRETIHERLVESMKNYANEKDAQKLKRVAKEKIDLITKEMQLEIPQVIYSKLSKELCDDVAGLGILEDFLSDSAITEIMVNGYDKIFIEKKGSLIHTDATFPDEKRLKTVIERIVSQVGRHIDEASPIVDARLKDGSRVNAVIRPISLNGPALTIRKFLKNKLSTSALVSGGSISQNMVDFLEIAVKLKQNIIISGGTGTGKTTLLNAVSSFIPQKERIVTIEDSAELQLQQEHVVRLESRPKSTEGTGEISIRRLVVNALRMRPDRIIVGECRSGETLDMLQAMNTGHEGSMSTVHANSPQDAVSRIITMVLMSGAELPENSILSQIGSAINVIVQLTRFADGTRKITNISVLSKSADSKNFEIKPVFLFNLEGIKDGYQMGTFKPTGFIPNFIMKASSKGINVNMEIFK